MSKLENFTEMIDVFEILKVYARDSNAHAF